MSWGIAVRKAGTYVYNKVGLKMILKIAAASGLVVVGVREWNDAKEYLEEKQDDLESLSGPLAAGAGLGILLLIGLAAGRR